MFDSNFKYSIFYDTNNILVSNVNSNTKSVSVTNYENNIPIGKRTITVEVTSPADLTSNNSVELTVDDISPEINITSPVNGYNTSNTTLNITFNITDNIFNETNELTYNVSVNEKNQSGTTTSGNNVNVEIQNALINGTNTITVKADDPAGNSKTVNITITVNTEKPEPNLSLIHISEPTRPY